MCLDILKIDKNYSDVKPRHPEGGPDGARDIEALYKGELLTWGAVGFQNNVSDSPVEIKSTKKKFRDDLKSALEEKDD